MLKMQFVQVHLALKVKSSENFFNELVLLVCFLLRIYVFIYNQKTTSKIIHFFTLKTWLLLFDFYFELQTSQFNVLIELMLLH